MSVIGQTALIALGCNQTSVWGNATSTVQRAKLLVAEQLQNDAKCSDCFATKAVPAGSGPDYINAVMAVQTTLSPPDLLRSLHDIEERAQRVRTTRWGQRTLDLDLLAVDDLVLPDTQTFAHWRDLDLVDQQRLAPDTLILPHPRLQDRAFVLVPLCDVAPDWVHPVIGRSAAAMCAALPQADRDSVVRLP